MNFITSSASDFNLDTISWITPRLAVTGVNGAMRMRKERDCYIINTALELDTPSDFKLPVDPFSHGTEEVGTVLNTLVGVIHEQLEGTGNKVIVHCLAGMERSVLTCVWYLCKHHDMEMDQAYETVRKVRPVALDRREWVNG